MKKIVLGLIILGSANVGYAAVQSSQQLPKSFGNSQATNSNNGCYEEIDTNII